MTGVGTRKTDATGRATGRRFGNKRTKICVRRHGAP
jgi:hypothetical protein